MSNKSLENIINLIKKTGDKCIILNQGKPSYVIMGVKDYEDLVLHRYQIKDLTREELLDKVNKEVAIWRASQTEEDLEKFNFSDDLERKREKQEISKEEETKYYPEPLE